jgi:RHS repeat-associated protein
MANQSSAPSSIISLPKGGGAMHGLGEKFSPDLFTGTGNFTVPIALPPGRNGFQPQISLGYSSGQGNGPFGLGWGLSIPGVARQTSKGIPQYDEQKDTFILSGAEDLVPVRREALFTEFRPRTEGLFARIRYYRNAQNAWWEVKTKDGLTSIYGLPETFGQKDMGESGVCADPSDPTNIFAWKLTQTTDPFGNIIKYTYRRDSAEEGPHHWDQLYLSKIEYADYDGGKFLVSVDFEYEETRPDPFSEFKSGYEIRTQWRCRHILVKTHPKTGAFQVRRYAFGYDNSAPNKASLLTSVLVTGFDDLGVESVEMPPLEFRYSQFDPLHKRDFSPVTGDDLPPVALSNPDFELADLDGNGLPDVLQLNGTARFWRNLGNGRFDLPRPLKDRPPVSLSDAGVQLLDADGDGRIDLLVTAGALSGYYSMEHGHQPDWDRRPFQKFNTAPSFNLKDPEVKWIDLTGNGVTDVLRSGTRFECFFFHPQKGWYDTRYWPRKSDLAVFPDVQFSDPRVKWADMSGDSMQDLVLVHDGNVAYYPNLGYGRFGKRIHMRNSPRFPHGFDPHRILLGDVDGDGLADLLYVDDQQVTLWVNQSGNHWSDPIVIPGTPPMTDQNSVRLIDLKGTGVSGILWSRDLGTAGRPHQFFLDLTGGGKPYLLHEMDNNIGALTRVEYGCSAEYYLMDEKERRHRWQTSLPMPVQVVKKVEVIDAVSKTKLTTAYRYHHGYWDGVEREFRGFGMVEQNDTLTEPAYNSTGLHPGASFEGVVDKKFAPPILTKTWFHQGPIRMKGDSWIEADYSREYWPGDPGFWEKGRMLQDLLRDAKLRAHEKRDALRALRGSILRTELYALDGSEQQDRPYTVTENCYDVQAINNTLQEADLKLIYFPVALSKRTTQWERGEEPMTQFGFTGDYDAYGQPRLQTQIACYRGWKQLSDAAQPFLATRTRTVFAEPVDPEIYIHDRVCSVRSWEIRNTLGKTVEQLGDAGDDALELELFSHLLTFYDGPAYKGRKNGETGEYGIPVRTEMLALTEAVLDAAYGETLYGGKHPVYFNRGQALKWPAEYDGLQDFKSAVSKFGYEYHNGTGLVYEKGYYIVSDRKAYDFQTGTGSKGLPVSALDPLANEQNPTGHNTEIAYDAYQLLPVKATQKLAGFPTGLVMTAEYNYRVMQPQKVTDPNGNESRFEFSPLGLLIKTWQMGKPNQVEGDRQRPGAVLAYDFLNFKNSGDPVWVKTTKYVHHDTETGVPAGALDETIVTCEYSDGFGRVVQTRTQAEAEIFGDVLFGSGILPESQGSPTDKAPLIWKTNADSANSNVVVSGWQLYDNKGQVIEKFEPFFSKGWDFKHPNEETDALGLPMVGKSIRMEYDPRGQVIRTINPDGAQQWVVYGIPGALETPDVFAPTPWEAYTYDANDLAPLSLAPNGASLFAQAPAAHHFTPAHIEIDALGRTVRAVQRLAKSQNPADWVETKSEYDIRGNLLRITDALGRRAFAHVYDLLNRPLLIDSIDAGSRTTVLDAAGNLLERRDQRGGLILQTYDDLNRPTFKWASDKTGEPVTLREKMEYGEPAPNAAAQNLLGKLHRHYDEAGVLTLAVYDFKGNLLEKTREVVADAAIETALQANKSFVMDWVTPPALSAPFTTNVAYDALNRVTKMTYPADVGGKRRELLPAYNHAGALQKVAFDGATYVERIAYNAKGQRILIAYGNKLMTRYTYDQETFRLTRLRTEKYANPAPDQYAPNGGVLQDFAYSYDLTGNILTIRDKTTGCGIGGANSLTRTFAYDALYRLRSATGRECDVAPPATGNSTVDQWLQMGFCEDPQLTRGYTQEYDYDKMGNMTQQRHIAGGANNYNKDFTTAPDSNRLQSAVFRGQPFDYQYDVNGNLTRETTSRFYEWDHSDLLIRFRIQSGAQSSQQAAYLYDAGGMRVKKLVRKQDGSWESRTYIDGIFEHTRNSAGEQNNHLHVMDNQSRIAILRTGDTLGDTWPAVQYHLGDHLGSGNVVRGGAKATDNTAVGREEYYPYGDTSFGSFAKKRYRYSGKEKDEESALYYYGARYYAGWLGRWVSCDPIGRDDGLNLFQFVHCNPIVGKDLIGFSDASGTAMLPEEEINMCTDKYFVEDKGGGGFVESSISFSNTDISKNTNTQKEDAPFDPSKISVMREEFNKKDKWLYGDTIPSKETIDCSGLALAMLRPAHEGFISDKDLFDEKKWKTQDYGKSGGADYLYNYMLSGESPLGEVDVTEIGDIRKFDLKSGDIVFWDYKVGDKSDKFINHIAIVLSGTELAHSRGKAGAPDSGPTINNPTSKTSGWLNDMGTGTKTQMYIMRAKEKADKK